MQGNHLKPFVYHPFHNLPNWLEEDDATIISASFWDEDCDNPPELDRYLARVPAGTKNPAPWDSHGRNYMKSTVDTNKIFLKTSIPWWSCLPLLRREIYGSSQSDAGNLFPRGWLMAVMLGLV
jgi:hypothetical protein